MMIRRDKIKNTILKFFIIFLLLPFMLPNVKEFNAGLHSIVNIFKVTNSILGCLLFIINYKRVKNNLNIIIPVFLFFSMYILSTKINHGDMNTSLVNSINVIAQTIIICWAMNYTRLCLEAMLFNYKMVIYINFLTLLFLPNGIYSVGADTFWFIGHDNTFIWIFIPSICISLLLSQITSKKLISKKNIILIIICTVSVFLNWTAMGIVGMMIFLLFISCEIIGKRYNIDLLKKLKVIFCSNFILYSFLLNISIVFFRIHHWFSFVIEKILHKSVSLSGRDQLWDVIIPYIYSNPILGYGIEFTEDRFEKLHIGYFTINHCHNIILNILYETGIIGFSIFTYFIIKTFKDLSNYKNNIYSRIISVSVGIYLFVLITESDQKYTIFTMLIIARFIKDIIRKYGNH